MQQEKWQEIIEYLRSLCGADRRIQAAFVGGSLATSTADEYSDLDLYVITSDEAYDSFFAERIAFLSQLGEPVYVEDFDGFGFDMVLFMLANGIGGELSLARASRFLHIHGGPYRVLVDESNLLQDVTFPPYRVQAAEQRANLEKSMRSFWRSCHLLAGALGRRRLLTAAQYFEDMREELMRVCRLSVDLADGGGHPPPEKLLPEALVEAYSGTYFELEHQQMVIAMQRAIDLFHQVARPLAQAQGVSYPAAFEQVVLKTIESSIQ